MIINGEEYISTKSRSSKSTLIAAHWIGVCGINPHGEAPLRIGNVNSFLKHQIVLDNENTLSHILVRVNWFQDHPCRSSFFHSSITCCSSVYETGSPACFMPVCRIAGQCAFVKTTQIFEYGMDNVIVCVPSVKFISLLIFFGISRYYNNEYNTSLL